MPTRIRLGCITCLRQFLTADRSRAATAISGPIMKNLSGLAMICIALALAGCAGGSAGGSSGGSSGGSPDSGAGNAKSSTTASRFVSPTGTGAINLTLDQSQTVHDVDSGGAGYSIMVGLDTAAGALTAVSGVVGASTVAAPPSAGQVIYDGDFQLLHIDRDTSADPSATVHDAQGTMMLIADFDVDQFAAQSRAMSGPSPLLSMEGSIANSGAMSGTVAYVSGTDTITGPLTGEIGSDKAVGAFHGKTDADAMAGGFLLLFQ